MEGEDVGVLAGGDLKFDAVQLPGEVLVLADELLLLVVCLLEVGVVGGLISLSRLLQEQLAIQVEFLAVGYFLVYYLADVHVL